MHYKLGQACVTNWAALFCYKLGQTLLQIGQLHYYKLGQVLLKIGAAIPN